MTDPKFTTDIEYWLDSNGPEDEDGLRDLLEAVGTLTESGLYSAKAAQNAGQIIVTGPATPPALILVTQKARNFLVNTVKGIDVPDDLELGYQRAIDNPRS